MVNVSELPCKHSTQETWAAEFLDLDCKWAALFYTGLVRECCCVCKHRFECDTTLKDEDIPVSLMTSIIVSKLIKETKDRTEQASARSFVEGEK